MHPPQQRLMGTVTTSNVALLETLLKEECVSADLQPGVGIRM